jgi:hypothetical protein
MTAGRFHPWRDAFLRVIQDPATAAPLKNASLTEDLKSWTTCLTSAVVASCQLLSWRAAAKGHRFEDHPQSGQEYLGIDVMAFAVAVPGGRWRLPLAVFELENQQSDDRVAYSLWKVLCLRADLRVVFAFRRDREESVQMVDAVCRDVVGGFSPEERMSLVGETALVIGNRGEGETFPWGYFKWWLLDTNLGRFEKV